MASSQIKSEKTLELERNIRLLQEEKQKILENTKNLLVKNEELTQMIKENEYIIEKNKVISNKQMEQIGLLEKELERHLEYENKLKVELEQKIRAEIFSSVSGSFSREPKELNVIKRKSIPKAIKNILGINNFGKDKSLGKCYVCEKEIHITEFEAGHILAVSKGGSNDISNLKPVCTTCNKSAGTDNLDDFKKSYLGFKKIFSTELYNFNFGYCKIKSVKINEKTLEIYNWIKIIVYICKLLKKDTFKKLTQLNIKSGEHNLNGFKYHSDIDLSIQGIDSNRAIREICRLLDLSKISYSFIIELKDENTVEIIPY